MAGFFDVYALAPARTADAVERFLSRFAPAREPSADEYEVPRYADAPAAVFRTAAELVAHCVAHPAEPHGVYWRSLAAGDPAHAMTFFSADGGLILGLSVVADAEQWLTELLAATAVRSAGWGSRSPLRTRRRSSLPWRHGRPNQPVCCQEDCFRAREGIELRPLSFPWGSQLPASTGQVSHVLRLCEVKRMAELIPDNQWAAIDACIVANKKIEAVKTIKDLTGCSLNEALIALYERYGRLRAETPDQFDRSNREYWTGFYTNGPRPPMAEPGTLPELEDL